MATAHALRGVGETMSTLLGPDVLVTRATIETAVERLALSAAHGTRQAATIREWVEQGLLTSVTEVIPVAPYGLHTAEFKGSCRLTGRSWLNLCKRLRASGFFIKRDGATHTYSLYWRG